jgi:hypothetical protein
MEFSDSVLEKARGLVAADAVRGDEEIPSIWWVESTERCRVQSDYTEATGKMTWITCTCKYGRRVGAGRSKCSHAAAVMLVLLAAREER